jgi:hypothetical protein
MVVSGQEEGNLCTNLYETKGKLSRGSHRQCMLIKFEKLLGLLGILPVAPEIYIKANIFFNKTFSFSFLSSLSSRLADASAQQHRKFSL